MDIDKTLDDLLAAHLKQSDGDKLYTLADIQRIFYVNYNTAVWMINRGFNKGLLIKQSDCSFDHFVNKRSE